MYEKYLKRIFDVLLSLIAIVFLSPIFLLVAILIFLEDGFPVIFKQQRIGRDDQYFTIYKFRSMPLNTQELPSAEARDLEITYAGKFIRRFSLDELPQLFNVLKGDMSLIGPRPILPSQHTFRSSRIVRGISNYYPGISGLPQVVATDDTTEEEKIVLDQKYCESICFRSDLAIYFKTFLYLFRKPPND